MTFWIAGITIAVLLVVDLLLLQRLLELERAMIRLFEGTNDAFVTFDEVLAATLDEVRHMEKRTVDLRRWIEALPCAHVYITPDDARDGGAL